MEGDGKVTNTNPSYAKITSLGDDTTVTFTVTGKDKDGGVLVDTIKGTNKSNCFWYKTI